MSSWERNYRQRPGGRRCGLVSRGNMRGGGNYCNELQNGKPDVAERSVAQDVVRGKTDGTPEVSR